MSGLCSSAIFRPDSPSSAWRTFQPASRNNSVRMERRASSSSISRTVFIQKADRARVFQVRTKTQALNDKVISEHDRTLRGVTAQNSWRSFSIVGDEVTSRFLDISRDHDSSRRRLQAF